MPSRKLPLRKMPLSIMKLEIHHFRFLFIWNLPFSFLFSHFLFFYHIFHQLPCELTILPFLPCSSISFNAHTCRHQLCLSLQTYARLARHEHHGRRSHLKQRAQHHDGGVVRRWQPRRPTPRGADSGPARGCVQLLAAVAPRAGAPVTPPRLWSLEIESVSIQEITPEA